mmetsp:Transcript_14498/g.40492  ORF Transcript_14498/g.40492 Transcript_14498/m.40492 type:complete len:228 (-) Transcript_14498:123-806(-)
MMASDLCECGSASGSEDADCEVLSSNFSLERLPPLPRRGSGYWSEPMMGICIVGVLSAMLVSVTQGMSMAGTGQVGGPQVAQVRTGSVILIWAEALTAVLCTLFLLFAGAGVILRSPATCYPIPDEVQERLIAGRNLDGLKNIRGEHGESYCVRCCLWRPSKEDGKVHHCNVCQRCVRGFDHHCGVFGRCIVRGNMPCFVVLIGMMFAGMVTAMVAVTASAGVDTGV